MGDVISEAADPIQAAIESAVEENSSPTDEQTEAANDVETEPTTVESTTPEAVKKDDTEDEEAALKALEAELVSKTPTLQRGRIGVSRHQAVLTRNRNKWDEERKTLETKIKEFEGKINDPETQRELQMLQLAKTDAGKFLGALEQLPQFKSLMTARIDAAIKAQQVAAPPAPKADETPAEAPQPDVLLADGRVTYSPEQMMKVAEWQTAQLTKKFSAELDKVRGEVKPVVEERRHAAELSAATERMTKLINTAREKWPGFKKYEAQIGAEIRKPENISAGMSLHEAYIAVVPGAIEKAQTEAQATADKKAAENLQQRVPKESIRPGSVPAVKADASEGKTDMEAIIKAAMKSAHLAA